MLSDGDGLVGEVRVSAGDVVSLSFRYGFKRAGKKARHYCGTWPTSSLEAIRAERDRARTLVNDGVKPTDAKRAARIEAQAAVEATIAEAARVEAENLPVHAMFEAWMSDDVLRSDGNAELRRCFEKDVLPAIGAKPVRYTTENDLRAILRAVIKRDACRMASRLHSDLIQMFKWAERRKPWRALMAEGNLAELIEFHKLLPPSVDPDSERERVLSGESCANYASSWTRWKTSMLRPVSAPSTASTARSSAKLLWRSGFVLAPCAGLANCSRLVGSMSTWPVANGRYRVQTPRPRWNGRCICLRLRFASSRPCMC